MKKLFEISQDEKQRILEMHETATKKNYLSEQSGPTPTQSTPTFTANGVNYYLPFITDNDSWSKFVSFNADLNELKSLGLPAKNNPKATLGNDNKIQRNMEAFTNRLISNYLSEIAKYTKSSQPICQGNKNSIVTPNVIKNAESEFKSENKFDAIEIYKYYNMVNTKFADVVAKAAQSQVKEKFPNVCNA